MPGTFVPPPPPVPSPPPVPAAPAPLAAGEKIKHLVLGLAAVAGGVGVLYVEYLGLRDGWLGDTEAILLLAFLLPCGLALRWAILPLQSESAQVGGAREWAAIAPGWAAAHYELVQQGYAAYIARYLGEPPDPLRHLDEITQDGQQVWTKARGHQVIDVAPQPAPAPPAAPPPPGVPFVPPPGTPPPPPLEEQPTQRLAGGALVPLRRAAARVVPPAPAGPMPRAAYTPDMEQLVTFYLAHGSASWRKAGAGLHWSRARWEGAAAALVAAGVLVDQGRAGYVLAARYAGYMASADPEALHAAIRADLW
jgi:hypothetical protein